MRATSVPVWSWMLKFHARQFSALMDPRLLPPGAELAALLVEDGVLVVDLDELGLLVHDQHRLGEDRPAALVAGGGAGLVDVPEDLLGRPVRGGDVARTGRLVDGLAVVGGHV